MNLIFIFSFILLTSCGFSSGDGSGGGINRENVQLQAGEDQDGDLIPNEVERSQGSDPKVADIPKLRIRFLQNYSLTGKAKNLETGEVEEFLIDTKTGRDDPDFKYRVGEVFVRHNAYKEAAKIGRFSGHSWGEVGERDLSWVRYPHLDPRFYLDKLLKLKKYFNRDLYEIEALSANLESSARLRDDSLYGEIKNLKVNFHYYDYEKESFETIKSKVVEKNFQRGVNETFKVKIDNLPENLVRENFLARGEFILSEVEDYIIPKLEVNYKNLLASVKERTLPIAFNTPLKGERYYVAARGGVRLSKVLETLFDRDFEIQNDELNKIGQFQNNLPSFEDLSELRGEKKKGRWFLFTTPLKKHFLDHEFKPGEFLSLSFITGDELSRQKREKIYSFRSQARGDEHGAIYPLGNITPHSRVSFQLKPRRLWGEKLKHWKDEVIADGGCSGRNCYGRKFHCYFQFNVFKSIDSKLKFNRNFSETLSRITLKINEEEFSLKNLVNQNKASAYWSEGKLHIELGNISEIKELSNVEENLISLKLKSIRKKTYNGVRLTKMTGRDKYFCPPVAAEIAGNNNWPLSTKSRQFGRWQRNVDWSKVKKGHPKTYRQNFSVKMAAIVENLFN